MNVILALATQEQARVVALSAATEAELVELDEADRQEFMTDLGLNEPGLNRVIRAGYPLQRTRPPDHRGKVR